jgi:UDP-3-O-[3-hydroxymyristoyl] glucosamine N-acyltransferase
MARLSAIASLVGGNLNGEDLEITGINSLTEACNTELSFILEEKKSKDIQTKACALLAPEGYANATVPVINVKAPRLAQAIIIDHFYPKESLKPCIHRSVIKGKDFIIGKNCQIDANVVIGDRVKIGSDCHLHPGVQIGNNVTIGNNVEIFPNAVVYPQTQIGDRVRLHSGSVIGGDGYGFLPEGKKWRKIQQVGKVILEDDVEIYANTCIARATLGSTIIKRGTKIDNLTHIAHNCTIGEDCAITSLIGTAGSVTLGNHVIVGGQAGFNGHITVGDNTVVMGRAGVTKNVAPNSNISGFPAQDHHKELEYQAALHKLTEGQKRSD